MHSQAHEPTHSIDLGRDVFGRERFRSHRGDMGGVGGFDSDCRSLYIGGIGLHDDLEEVIWKEFGEFGVPEVGACGIYSLEQP